MVQELRRVLGRVDARVLGLLALFILIATLGLAVAQLVKADDDPQSVATWDDLVKRYLVFREDSYQMVVPSWYLAADQVEEVWGQEGFAGFQNQPDWFTTFDMGTLTFPTKSALAQQVKSGTRLVIYEDMTTSELVMCSLPEKDGSELREEIVFKSLPWPEIEKSDATAHYLARELSKRRLVWQVTLKDEAQAQTEAEAAALVAPDDEDGGMMQMMSGGEDELRISAMTRTTNGLLLELTYPDTFSGLVWSAYGYDVQFCSTTNAAGGGGTPQPPGTNDPPGCTNCPAQVCDFETTNNFMGLEPAWQLMAGNVELTGETRTVWLDTRPMGFDAQTNPVHRFYGFGANTDNDNDSLNDGYELFVTKTVPTNADTDGDGLNDGWEVENGLNPLSAVGDDGADGDPDQDGWTNFEEIENGTAPTNQLDVSYFGPGLMIGEVVYLPTSGQPQ